MPSENVATLSRRVLGAKRKFYERRGVPTVWEIKAAAYIKPGPWRRANNRDFVKEVARIVREAGGTTYSVSITKANTIHLKSPVQTMPLMLQALVEHFAAECRHLDATGIVVSDWSSHNFDQHASRCVASYVASNRLPIHPSVYYASSHATESIQVADLFAGARRRIDEGAGPAGLEEVLAEVSAVDSAQNLRTFKGRRFNSHIVLF